MGMESRETKGEEMADQMLAKRRCCSWLPCFGSDDKSNSDGGGAAALCWSKGWNVLLKIREWSEIVAVPRWKKFIRRFKKNNDEKGGDGGGCGGGVGLNNKGKFQYDPLSYALNFDEGPAQSDYPDKDSLYRDFSSRYASIPISVKSSMDFGSDAPSFSRR
ncbi:uncharacterized protein LOC122672018 [Telopea speciosissima]|uniref:uncharacterized protein LOC122672018 n=1 Tax=Telopea speciosissima TaxID=54955 RepID=UPI001CC78526|nr:uncharacterized protein LOC122672018 [Telopea speciosissima]